MTSINNIINAAGQQASAAHTVRPNDSKNIDKVAKDFEAVFIGEMLQSMFKDVKTDPVLGGGQSEEIFRSMLLDQYGKEMTDKGGLGLAQHIKAELLRMQEVK